MEQFFLDGFAKRSETPGVGFDKDSGMTYDGCGATFGGVGGFKDSKCPELKISSFFLPQKIPGNLKPSVNLRDKWREKHWEADRRAKLTE